MSPTDHKVVMTTTAGKTKQMRLVFLEADERLLLMREGRGFVAAIPYPLCEHRHKRMEDAATCGLKAAQDWVAHTEESG